jgi:tetratricopeptide (TPR) repeat protein
MLRRNYVYRTQYVFLLILMTTALTAFADFKEQLYKADLLDLQGRYTEEKELLLSLRSQAADNVQKAEVYWRLSRTCLQFGDEKKLEGASAQALLPLFEEGIRYADTAIQLNPDNAQGYFWKASNSGLWGQTKGILESLQKAEEMKEMLFVAMAYDPGYSGSYYVLAQLYDQVPGWPVSFGNIDFAVSLARKAIDVHKQDLADGTYDIVYYDFYIELAKYLWIRNWDARKRSREQENKRREYYNKSSTMEKYCYYEGVVEIKSVSDRQEAEQLLDWAISELEKINPKYPFQEKALDKAKKVKREWR